MKKNCECKNWRVESLIIPIQNSKIKIYRVQQVCKDCGNVLHLYDERK